MHFVQLLKMRQIFTFFLLFLPLQLVLDYNDLMKIPFLSNYISEVTRDTKEFKLRYILLSYKLLKQSKPKADECCGNII